MIDLVVLPRMDASLQVDAQDVTAAAQHTALPQLPAPQAADLPTCHNKQKHSACPSNAFATMKNSSQGSSAVHNDTNAKNSSMAGVSLFSSSCFFFVAVLVFLVGNYVLISLFAAVLISTRQCLWFNAWCLRAVCFLSPTSF